MVRYQQQIQLWTIIREKGAELRNLNYRNLKNVCVRIGTGYDTVWNNLLFFSLRTLPIFLAWFISFTSFLAIWHKCIFLSIERRVTGCDKRLRHWHVPVFEFLNNSEKYKKLCEEIDNVKRFFPSRFFIFWYWY